MTATANWTRHTVTGEPLYRFVDEVGPWKVGAYCIESSPYPYQKDRDAVWEVRGLEERANGDVVITAHDISFYSASTYGWRTQHAEGFIGPFGSVEEARAAISLSR